MSSIPVADETILRWRDSYTRSAGKYEDPDDTTRFKWYKYSPEDMVAHWQGLIDLIPANATSILECGCGTGTLAEMLRDQRPELKYQGFDIVPANVLDARTRVPEYDFRIGNYWEELNKAPTWDFVLSCGVLFTTTGPEDVGMLFDLLNAKAEKGYAVITLKFKSQGIPVATLDPRMEAAIAASTGVDGFYYTGPRDFLPTTVLKYNRPFYLHRETSGGAEAPDVPERLIHPDILGGDDHEYMSLFDE